MQKKNTVIFDLDGTLLDTSEDLKNATNAAIGKFGFPPRKVEEICAFLGNGTQKLLQRAIGEENFTQFDDLITYYKGYYAEHCKDKTAPYPHIMEMLTVLKEKGYKTAVVSNKPNFLVKELCSHYFGDLLTLAFGEDKTLNIPTKPSPEGVWMAMEALGSTKEETVFVGDSETDFQTGKNAGVPCISVTWGFRTKEQLKACGATLLVDDAMEILSLL